MSNRSLVPLTATALVALILGACSKTSTPLVAAHIPLLPVMHTQKTIGPTVDPTNGDLNPYGLAVAPGANGNIAAGDLVICNFNDGPTNTQGNGTTVVGLHPVPGSTPYRVAQTASLQGCDALSMAPDGTLLTANMVANDVDVVSNGSATPVPATGFPQNNPWGMIYASNASGTDTFYATNEADGSIHRIMSSSNTVTSTTIATGFPTSNSVPGTVLAPSGLTYDPASDTLYIVDGQSNDITAFSGVAAFGANAIARSGSTFSGPSAASARIIASGPPLNGPISAALMPNGNLIVGNTLDATGTNLLVEVNPLQGSVATKNVDSGAGGAIFGIAVSGTGRDNTIVYFNDDNSATVQALSK
jgi:hypothetical protein